MKKGFTLAETLVALAIIGVVAGIMLPVINNARPNREMVMFKKAYYLAGKTITELINDDSLYPETDDPATSGFANTSRVLYKGEGYEGNSKLCGLLAAKMNSTCNGGTFTTSDGMVWIVNFDSNTGSATIQVDVNGGNIECNDNGDNACEPDQFNLRVSSDGVIGVAGGLGNVYLSENDTTKKARELLRTNEE